MRKSFRIECCLFALILLAAYFDQSKKMSVNADLYTSQEQMVQLVTTHSQVTSYLRDFLSLQYKQLDDAKK